MAVIALSRKKTAKHARIKRSIPVYTGYGKLKPADLKKAQEVFMTLRLRRQQATANGG